jgi:hypothetical protein
MTKSELPLARGLAPDEMKCCLGTLFRVTQGETATDEEGHMNLGSMVKDVGGKIADQVSQKASETMNDANRLLALLQEAGYKVSEFEAELKAIPKMTISLTTDAMVSDTKLESIIQANKENDVIALVLSALAQANKLRGKVSLNTIELKGAKIVLEATPSVSLQWKEKAAAGAASAS